MSLGGKTLMYNQKIIAIGIVGLFFLSAGIVTSEYNAKIKTESMTVSTDAFNLLIIAPEEFTDELSSLIDHKNDMGMKTSLVTFETIQTSEHTTQGQDDAEKMKYYIKYALETSDISYVLLVGGRIGQSNDWYLPVRYVHMDNGWESRFMSDLYFADIYNQDGTFSTWNKDSDSYFAEWIEGSIPEDKDIDLYPDVAVGRLPCRSEKEVTTVVEKIISYETSTYDEPWFNKMLAIAGDTYLEIDDPLWKGIEGEEYANLALDHMNEFTPTRLFLSDGTLTGSQDVIDAYNQGFGFVYFVGHGNPRTWGNHPPNDHEFVDGLQNNEMNKLNNEDMYPVCVVSGCHNNQFDVTIRHLLKGFLEDGFQFFSPSGGKVWRFEWVPECWGWKMTNQENGGSIVTYGASALGHTKEDKSSFTGGINEFEVELFRQYGVEGVNHAGDLLKNTVTWYLDTYPVDWSATDETTLLDTWVDVQVAQSYVLLGDPSLRIGGYSN